MLRRGAPAPTRGTAEHLHDVRWSLAGGRLLRAVACLTWDPALFDSMIAAVGDVPALERQAHEPRQKSSHNRLRSDKRARGHRGRARKVRPHPARPKRPGSSARTALTSMGPRGTLGKRCSPAPPRRALYGRSGSRPQRRHFTSTALPSTGGAGCSTRISWHSCGPRRWRNPSGFGTTSLHLPAVRRATPSPAPLLRCWAREHEPRVYERAPLPDAPGIINERWGRRERSDHRRQLMLMDIRKRASAAI